MSTILSIATHATDDPTKASLAFITAVGALGAQTEVTIALVGEGAYLAKAQVRAGIQGVGYPPMNDLAQQVVDAGVPIYV